MPPTQRRNADNTGDDEAERSDADQAVADRNAELQAVQAELEATQQRLREAQAEHEQKTAELQTQLQLANAAAGRASMADVANSGDVETDPSWDEAEHGYVVLASAVTIKTGKDREAARRFVRGAKVSVIPGVNEEGIARLVQLKALAPNDGRTKRATTARVATMAAGAAMDDVANTPIVAFAPLNVPAPDQAAQAQAQSDAADETETEPSNPETANAQ